MNRKEIDEMRGKQLTVGRHSFVFTRKPVKSTVDVTNRKTDIALLEHQIEQMEEAIKIGKTVRKTYEEDITHFFRVRRERALKEDTATGHTLQLNLFEEGAVVEDQENNRPKLVAHEPVPKPSKKKAASG